MIWLFGYLMILVIWLIGYLVICCRMSDVGCRMICPMTDVRCPMYYSFQISDLLSRSLRARDVALLRLRFFRRCGATSLHSHFPLSTFHFQLIINPPSCVFVQFILSFHITYHIMQYTIDKYVTLRC